MKIVKHGTQSSINNSCLIYPISIILSSMFILSTLNEWQLTYIRNYAPGISLYYWLSTHIVYSKHGKNKLQLFT